MMKVLFLALILSCTTLSAYAVPASHETRLIKLSKSLKGIPPSLQEREELKTATAQGGAEAYLDAKTKEYVNDTRFTFKLKQKVDELVRVRVALDKQAPVNFFAAPALSAYDMVIRDTIAGNLPWSHLLTGKTYKAFVASYTDRNEQRFYQNLMPVNLGQTILEAIQTESAELNIDTPPPYTFEFPANDQRVSGIVTTPRFFERYVTTALNKDRKRAAAVFRVFLCDTMIATAPIADSNSENIDYGTIFPKHQNLTEQDIRKSFSGDVHGQQADCMKCHYKLDPLGQVFRLSPVGLSPTASPGALVYQGQDGRKVNIPVQGFGDLGEQISQQPEYAQCQVSHFWRWYIGKDIPLTPKIETELVQAFERVGRRPKDFVSYLVTRPEFKERPQVLSEAQILAHRVTTIFQNCNSCHDSQGANVWDLTALPYGNDAKTRAEAIALLGKVLDIKNDGANAEMPPSDSLWRPTKDEFNSIKKWLDMGAPDFLGQPQVTPGGAQ